MSHSTLHGFHSLVIIQSLRIGTSAVKHLNGGILWAHRGSYTLVIVAPQDIFAWCTDEQKEIWYCFTSVKVPHSKSQVKTSWEDFCHEQTAPEWAGPKLLFNLSGKNVAPSDLSHLWKQRGIVPLLSALLLWLLMVSVGVHLRGFLPLRWKDEWMHRK